MQQQKERETDSKEITANNPLVYRYNIYFFRRSRIFMLIGMCSIIVMLVLTIMIKIPFIVLVAPMVLLCGRVLLGRSRIEERWVQEHGHETLAVDNQGIEWHGHDKTVYMRWEEVTQAYTENNIYVLVKQGVEEEQIRFCDVGYCLSEVNKKPNFRGLETVAPLIRQYCPLLKNHPWESKDEETIGIKSSYATYQMSRGQIFSYHTKENILIFNLISNISLIFLVIFSLIIIFIAKINNLSFLIALISDLFLIIVTLYFIFYAKIWYENSQIETDDLGIVLIKQNKIKWRLLWFTINKYTVFENSFTEREYGILETKDGKTYTFLRKTARAKELDAEIWRRIGAENTEQKA
jgi:hypothetical protein